MNKQEFLAMSLPYKPYCKTDIHDGINKNLILSLSGLIKDYARFYHKGYYFNCSLDDFKPILHPLSDLTKPIVHKGEEFVPMKEIAIYNPNNVEYLIECVVTGLVEYIVLRQLIEWRFDIAGLIEKGEAVDVNTLPENPYK